MKKHILLLTLVLALLSSCVQKENIEPIVIPKPEKGTFELPKGNVSEPDHEVTWIRNQLSYKREYYELNPSDKTKVQTQSFIVDGLKDGVVEAKINKAIADKIDSLAKYADFKNIPPSQGLYAKYPKDTTVVQLVSIYVHDAFNYNNILSISISTTLVVDKTYESNITIYESMTFDLNTGNIVNLSDLFINGFDFETTLNSLVLVDAFSKTEEALDSLFDSYIYRGGFTGIRSDVDFYLSDGGLVLTFNSTYKEFDSGFSDTIIYIPYIQLKDAWAFGQRFMSEESLFTDPTIVRQNNYLYTFDLGENEFMLNDIRFKTWSAIFEGIDGVWLNLIETLKAEDTNQFKSFQKKDVDRVNYKFRANIVSQYLQVSRRFETYKYNSDGDWYESVITEKINMYTLEGKILTLDDVFVDGYDYESTIKTLLAQNINEGYYYFDEGKIPTVDEAYESLNFTLNYNSISFRNFSGTPPDQNNNEIFLNLRIEDYKAYINPEVLLK